MTIKLVIPFLRRLDIKERVSESDASNRCRAHARRIEQWQA
jgi:hypothetical protein